MKLCLVNPRFPDTFWGFRHVTDLGGYRYAMANLALPTIAGLTPPDVEVVICDENIEEIDFDADADLIGITGFNIQGQRMFEIARLFRERGKPVVIGGPYASLCPEECEPHADILMVGECERIWPRFISDYLGGRWEPRYEEREKLDLRLSPIPRWDLMKFEHLGRAAVQTTRGCPFECEFCDVIVFLGRKVRQKDPGQVVAELEALYPCLYKVGKDSVFFADDNFIGNKRYARETLKAVIDLNRSFRRPLRFSTQVTVNLAKEPEILELMREADFRSVFIGVETPDYENLRAANKVQNTTGDLLENIRKIQSYGLFVWAGMIVGFDNDDTTVFEKQLRFMQDSSIPISMTGMLNAPARTPLWERLKREGRLLEGHQYEDQADTNILPKNMTLEELRGGYVRLMQELYSYDNYAARLLGSLRAIEKPAIRRAREFSFRHASYNVRRLVKMIRYYIFSGDAERRRFFLKIIASLLREKPEYFKEGLWHLAVHKHLHEYSQQLGKAPQETMKLA